jgi:hypothetical protein
VRFDFQARPAQPPDPHIRTHSSTINRTIVRNI